MLTVVVLCIVVLGGVVLMKRGIFAGFAGGVQRVLVGSPTNVGGNREFAQGLAAAVRAVRPEIAAQVKNGTGDVIYVMLLAPAVAYPALSTELLNLTRDLNQACAKIVKESRERSKGARGLGVVSDGQQVPTVRLEMSESLNGGWEAFVGLSPAAARTRAGVDDQTPFLATPPTEKLDAGMDRGPVSGPRGPRIPAPPTRKVPGVVPEIRETTVQLWVDGHQVGSRILRFDQVLWLGRSEKADLIVPNELDGISRMHLKLQLLLGGVRVVDNNSANGTWVIAADGGRRKVPGGGPVDVPSGGCLFLGSDGRVRVVFSGVTR